MDRQTVQEEQKVRKEWTKELYGKSEKSEKKEKGREEGRGEKSVKEPTWETGINWIQLSSPTSLLFTTHSASIH